MLICLIIAIIIAAAGAEIDLDSAANQLLRFKEETTGPIGIMTTSAGAPISYTDATVSMNSIIIDNEYLVDSITHFNRERIPPRVVHAKGIGAFGYFEVTRDVGHICKADFLIGVGKKTPAAVRFSSVTKEIGGSDVPNDGRGFAVKLYTQKGNFDLVCLNMPVFLNKEALKFVNLIHSSKKNPATNLDDNLAVWDYLSYNPESFYAFFYILGDHGVPASFSNMPGYSIHTYQVENIHGKMSFVRFHIIPDAGIKTLTEEAMKNATQQPDFYTELLYTSIERREYPSWTISVQVVPLEDAKNDPNNTFDLTKVLSIMKYPLQEIGRLVLNRNPKNHFAQIEQLAFCPCNLVDGIYGEPTKIFETRRFAYRDAQYYRLGANFYKINVNCPFRSATYVYNRDGVPPVGDNENDAPNYYPNSFNGPIPSETLRRSLIHIVENSEPNNFEQVSEFYNGMTSDEQKRLIRNILSTLRLTTRSIKKKIIAIFEKINSDLAHKVSRGLGANQTTSD